MYSPLTGLSWAPAPARYAGDDANVLLADTPQLKLVVSYNIDTARSGLAVHYGNRWYDSSKTQDWAMLDKLFTRSGWRDYLDAHELESEELLGIHDED